MYLKKIEINRFRNFNRTEIEFQDGINIIIGPNNSGKSNLLKVINLLDNIGENTSSIHNFNKNDIVQNFKKYKEMPPKIEIIYYIEHQMNLDIFDDGILRFKNFIIYNTDGKVVSDSDGEYTINAAIKLNFEFDNKFLNDYKSIMKNVVDLKSFFTSLEKMLSYYSWNYYNTTSNNSVKKNEVQNIFNIDFVPADRKTNETLPLTKEYVKNKLNDFEHRIDLRNDISDKINTDLCNITNEIKAIIEKDEDSIGIKNGNNVIIPSFTYDSPFENYFDFALKDVDLSYDIPMDNNGLGYNNLIQIYGIIKFKIDNAYNILLIEEPEAHLHPAMQYKLFQYLKKLKKKDAYNEGESIIKNQIFITTHSPNVTASADLDDMISLFYYRCPELHLYEAEAVNLKNKFVNLKNKKMHEGLQKSKQHLTKFLDVTRSDLLFTQKTILVEGLAEKLLMPEFAKKCGLEYELEYNHISIIEVGGITFNNFIPLFLETKNKLLYFQDCDYKYYANTDSGVALKDICSYETHLKKNAFDKKYKKNKNIKLFTQQHYGSTFENELFLDNYDNKAVIIALFNIVSPGKLGTFISKHKFAIIGCNDNLKKLGNKNTEEKIKEFIIPYIKKYEECTDSTDKELIEKLFFANLFLSYAKNSKGDLALEILTSGLIEKIVVPTYIRRGLEWLKA
ncbi:MAG: ATP-dependent endonuclease [Sedimentibacter sp.]